VKTESFKLFTRESGIADSLIASAVREAAGEPIAGPNEHLDLIESLRLVALRFTTKK
jgi:hypothetical protein